MSGHLFPDMLVYLKPYDTFVGCLNTHVVLYVNTGEHNSNVGKIWRNATLVCACSKRFSWIDWGSNLKERQKGRTSAHISNQY